MFAGGAGESHVPTSTAMLAAAAQWSWVTRSDVASSASAAAASGASTLSAARSSVTSAFTAAISKTSSPPEALEKPVALQKPAALPRSQALDDDDDNEICRAIHIGEFASPAQEPEIQGFREKVSSSVSAVGSRAYHAMPTVADNAEVALHGISAARIGIKYIRRVTEATLTDAENAVCSSSTSNPNGNSDLNAAAVNTIYATKKVAALSLGAMELAATGVHSTVGGAAKLYGVPVAEIDARDEAKALDRFVERLLQSPELRGVSSMSLIRALSAWDALQQASGTPYPPTASAIKEACFDLEADQALWSLTSEELPELLALCICVQGLTAAKSAFGLFKTSWTSDPMVLACNVLPWALKESDILRSDLVAHGRRPGYVLFMDSGRRSCRANQARRLVLAIRGAEGACLGEALEELVRPVTVSSGGYVGDLFHRAKQQFSAPKAGAIYREAAEQLDLELREIVAGLVAPDGLYARCPLLLCGHGSGGAAAALLAIRWSHGMKYGKGLDVITSVHAFAFNAPGLLAPAEARQCEKIVTSVVVGRDAVSRASPWSMQGLLHMLATLAKVESEIDHAPPSSSTSSASGSGPPYDVVSISAVLAAARDAREEQAGIPSLVANGDSSQREEKVALAGLSASDAARFMAAELRCRMETACSGRRSEMLLLPPGRTLLLVPPADVARSLGGELNVVQGGRCLTAGGAAVVQLSNGLAACLGELLPTAPAMFSDHWPRTTLELLGGLRKQ